MAGGRPTITRGLALSANLFEDFFVTLIGAISMPRRMYSYNRLIFKGILKSGEFHKAKTYDVF